MTLEEGAIRKIISLLVCPGQRHPVEDDRDQHDADPQLQCLTNPQLIQREQQIVSQPLCADERSDDRHRQTLHDYLVHTDQNVAPCRRDQHPEEELEVAATAHHARFDDLRRHVFEPQQGQTHHRRGCEDDGCNRAGVIAYPEEHHHRNQIGKMRHCLRDIEQWVQCRFDRFAPVRPDTEYHPQNDGDRCRNQNERQRLHRGLPLPERSDVYAGEPHQHRQTFALERITENNPAARDNRPRKCRPTRPLVITDKIPAGKSHDGLDPAEKNLPNQLDQKKNSAGDRSGHYRQQRLALVILDLRVVDLNRHPFEHQIVGALIDQYGQLLDQRRQAPEYVRVGGSDRERKREEYEQQNTELQQFGMFCQESHNRAQS